VIKRFWLILGAAMLLAACGRGKDGGTDVSNPLEAAARDRGMVQADRAAPTGVFERRHDMGRDALCVVPQDGDDYRFALTAAFGTGLVCQSSGILHDADGVWTLRFAGTDGCEVIVREENDALRLPGSIPAACARLCPNRASISGLRLPRASWDEQHAVRARFTRPDGKPGVGCAN